MWAQAKQLAHESGISQDQFSKFAGLVAGARVSETARLKTARDAEITKLGPAGSARVTAVQSFLNAQLGEADGNFMGNMLVTAQHVKGFETLMAAFRNQGAGSFSPDRAPTAPAKLSDEQVSKMTYSERKEYAARHSTGATSH